MKNLEIHTCAFPIFRPPDYIRAEQFGIKELCWQKTKRNWVNYERER